VAETDLSPWRRPWHVTPDPYLLPGVVENRATDVPPPVVVRPRSFGGLQALWRFPNGYGASVIEGYGSYGIELAVIEWTGEGFDDWGLTYTTPVTDDVLGHLDPAALIETLRDIRDLPHVRAITL
jgi:hypothetical protein